MAMRNAKAKTYQEHGQGLAHDGIEEVLRTGACHHEEITNKQILPATVVQEGIVLAAEQTLKGVLKAKQISITYF